MTINTNMTVTVCVTTELNKLGRNPLKWLIYCLKFDSFWLTNFAWCCFRQPWNLSNAVYTRSVCNGSVEVAESRKLWMTISITPLSTETEGIKSHVYDIKKKETLISDNTRFDIWRLQVTRGHVDLVMRLQDSVLRVQFNAAYPHWHLWETI